MKKLLLFISLLLIRTGDTYSQWERTGGPEGSAINSVKIIGGQIYAATQTDGLYHSSNDGVSWQSLNTGMENENVRAVVSKSGYLFAGTMKGVFRSSNNGNSWIAPSPQFNFGVHDMVVKDSIIFAASFGVYFSVDNGVTWQLTDLFQGSYSSLCVNGNNIFAAGSTELDESQDNGKTWTKLSQFESVITWSLYSMDNMIFVGGVNKIYRSTNAGNTFTLIPIPFPFSIVNIYSFTSIGSELFIGTSYDGVYKSTDNGDTWSAVIKGMGPKDIRSVTASGTKLIAGSHYSGMYTSSNGGIDWDRANSGLPPSASVRKLITDGTSVYAGTRDGVFLSTDNGRIWEKLTGTSDTINYGDVVAMCVHNHNLFATARYHFNSTVFKYSDQGWTRSDSGIPSDLIFIFGMAASGNNVLAGTDRGIFYSTNEGDSWNPTSLQSGFGIVDIGSADNGHVYTISRSQGVYISADDGINWSPSLMFFGFTQISGYENYAFVSGSNLGVYFTNDFGNSWAPSAGIGSGSVFAVAKAGNGMVLAGTEYNLNRIWVSYNNAASFTPFSEGLTPGVIAENFTVTDSFFFAGMDYNGVWKRLKPGLSNIFNENSLPQVYNLEQNYPNPFNPATNIKFSVPREARVNITVYDVLGRKLVTLLNEIKKAGSYSVKFDGSEYSSGIYFYRFETNDFFDTKKMQIIK